MVQELGGTFAVGVVIFGRAALLCCRLTRSRDPPTALLCMKLEEEAAGGASDRQAKEKVADLEGRLARVTRDKAALEDQLAEERANRQEVRWLWVAKSMSSLVGGLLAYAHKPALR